MGDSETPWRKYGIALLLVVLIGAISEIPDLYLPSPQDPGWTPLLGLVQAVSAGVGFGLIVFVATAFSRKSRAEDRRYRLRKGIYASLIVGGGYLVVGFSTPAHPVHTELQLVLARIVEAGGGYLLPALSLALFFGVIFLKTRRSH